MHKNCNTNVCGKKFFYSIEPKIREKIWFIMTYISIAKIEIQPQIYENVLMWVTGALM